MLVGRDLGEAREGKLCLGCNICDKNKKIIYLPKKLSLKKMKFSGKWMELEEKISLSEVSQIKKDKYDIYSLVCEY